MQRAVLLELVHCSFRRIVHYAFRCLVHYFFRRLVHYFFRRSRTYFFIRLIVRRHFIKRSSCFLAISYVRCISIYDSLYFFIRFVVFLYKSVVFLHTFVVFLDTICCGTCLFKRSLYLYKRFVVFLDTIRCISLADHYISLYDWL